MSTTSAPISGQPGRGQPLDPARRDRYFGLLAGAIGALAMIATFILLRPFTNDISVMVATRAVMRSPRTRSAPGDQRRR